MISKFILKDRNEWLDKRSATIGGSEAAAVIGLSPWMSNTELWDIKKNGTSGKDVSDSPLVVYGTKAESLLRELFRLDFPDQVVFYEENNLFKNTEFPWAHASLDGWLKDEGGRRGVLEIKTATPMNAMQWRKWQGDIPDHYFVQVLHEMAIYEADYAIVKAQLKSRKGDELEIKTYHYHIERSEVQDQIDYLMEAEKTFWESIQENRRPGRILPEL